MHQIGEVMEAVGLSLRTIRHYDEVGLVPPSGRSRGGFRLYTDDDIARLRLIKHMKPLGFSLEEVRDLLEVRDRLAAGVDDGDDQAALLERLGMYAHVAEERCERLQLELQMAEALVETLRREARRRGRAGSRP
ncbi:MAG: MerR family transcriptional regulator [Actinomycetota bacterium]|nr:MerR family transcriptional regulator [Actinomycetota bacterium]